MLSRKAKAAFYAAAGPLMRFNGRIHRHLRSPAKGLKVQLGPGQEKYIDGWVNVDANMFTAKCDIWADLRFPLPFADQSVRCFYSHHVIEHLPDMAAHFAEVFRCLEPGGVYRVGGPNADSAIKKFASHDTAWFFDFPDKRESIGGKLDNFIYCRGEHLSMLTFSYLDELLKAQGFKEVALRQPVRETGFPELFTPCMEKEWENDFDTPHTIVVEAIK